ncbi:MAG: serine/threonine protein kinase, partial [Myxococcales bacterium]|nr:serine/threonine protein kinase [Myxococcales bacterium]
MSEINLEPGTRLGEFVVESRLGVGGMGSVYAAHHADSGAEVALKIMHAASEHYDVLRRRFLREARATMALSHPNLIRIVSSFEHEGEPVIAMERLRGISLKEYLKGHGKLPFPEVASIFVRIVSGVGSAHALGLVHRDLKPDNVFLLE